MEEKQNNTNNGVSIKVIGGVSTIIIAVVSLLLFGSLFFLSSGFRNVQNSTQDYMSWKDTALMVKDASDYLTDQVRYYVYNKDKEYMDNYFYEADVAKRRDKAIAVIEEHLPDTEAHKGLDAAVKRSNELMEDEFYAMRLIVETLHLDDEVYKTYPEKVRLVNLDPTDIALSDEAKCDLALNYVLGDNYIEAKEFIISKVEYVVDEIDLMMKEDILSSTAFLKNILIFQQMLISINIILIAGIILLIYGSLIRPINFAVDKLKNKEDMEVKGVKEYRYLAHVYNTVREESNNIKEMLEFQAEHDQLTGLYNRAGYDAIYKKAKLDKCYYILIDIDYFKKVNDKYGHDSGDEVIVKVANAISSVFNKENEFAFRIGGDEFSVLIEQNENIKIGELIENCRKVTELINKQGKKIPNITLSIGIAKGNENDTTDTLFKKADEALYQVKNNGRHDISVYESK